MKKKIFTRQSEKSSELTLNKKWKKIKLFNSKTVEKMKKKFQTNFTCKFIALNNFFLYKRCLRPK
jgi:hypothetical protein